MHTVIGDKKLKHPKQRTNKPVNERRLGGPILQFPSAAIARGKHSCIEGPEPS